MDREKPILVIGDTCLDVFYYGVCDRLAPDSPVPVLDIIKEEKTLGMAGNVHRNLFDLDAPLTNLICNPNFESITKTRYVDIKTNHMFIRIDSKAEYPRIDQTLLSNIPYDYCSAIVISDYNKGFLTEDDIKYITSRHPLTFLDSKKILGSWADDVTFIKINRKEFKASEYYIKNSSAINKTIETVGSEGCIYQGKKFPVKPVEVKNLSGAGDSFLAGLVLEYTKSNNIEKAIEFGNNVATIIVQKLGISTIK